MQMKNHSKGRLHRDCSEELVLWETPAVEFLRSSAKRLPSLQDPVPVASWVPAPSLTLHTKHQLEEGEEESRLREKNTQKERERETEGAGWRRRESERGTHFK